MKIKKVMWAIVMIALFLWLYNHSSYFTIPGSLRGATINIDKFQVSATQEFWWGTKSYSYQISATWNKNIGPPY